MTRPITKPPAIREHWPSPDTNALGQPMPMCKSNGSYYVRPLMAKRPEDVTCETCRRWAQREMT